MLVALAQVDVSKLRPFLPTSSAKMVLCVIFLAAGTFTLPVQKVLAQEFPSGSGGVTLTQALSRALESNPDLAAADKEVLATDAVIEQAAVRVNPEVSLFVEDLKKQTRTTTVQVNQVLEIGNKRNARINAALRNLDAAELDRQVKQSDIRASVINAFFDMLIAQERLSLAQSSAALADRATGVASRRVIAGKLSPVEETKAKVAKPMCFSIFTKPKATLM